MLVTANLPEEWTTKIVDLFWRGLPNKGSKFGLQSGIKNNVISIEMGSYYLYRDSSKCREVSKKVLRTLWKSQISLTVELERTFRGDEINRLLSENNFETFSLAKNRKALLVDNDTYTIKLKKDIGIFLTLSGTTDTFTSKPKNNLGVLRLFEELYKWKPLENVSTSISDVQLWDPTFV